MPRRVLLLAFASLALAAAAFGGQAAAVRDELNVTVTIRPIHALVARLMQGAGEPHLLITGGASPHSFALKPSDARALAQSDLVIRVSPALETPLNAALETLPDQARVISLHKTPGIRLLPSREGGVWEAHNHVAEVSDTHEHHHPHEGEPDGHGHAHVGHDPHVWLDPGNAEAIVRHIADALAELQPENRALFQENAAKILKDLDALDAELSAMTQPVRDLPYIVFHDAYQYFENRYGLNARGSVTVSPERQPSAKRIMELRSIIENAGAICVFAEPQFEPRLMATIVEGSGAETGVLDPEGTGMREGADGYFDLMRALGRNLAECLGGAAG